MARLADAGGKYQGHLPNIDEFSSDAYALDYLNAVPRYTGASLSNRLQRRERLGVKDSLPVHMRFGLSHRPAHMPVPMPTSPTSTYLTVNRLGLEAQAFGTTAPSATACNRRLSKRTGWACRLVGFAAKQYRLDYAYRPTLI